MSIREKIALVRKRGEDFGRTLEGRALDNRMLVARNIIALLKFRKLTQSEFCDRIDMKIAQFNRFCLRYIGEQ